MVDRYHALLAITAVGAGCLIVAVDALARRSRGTAASWLSPRTCAAAVAVGVALGSLALDGGIVFLAAAAVLAVPSESPDRPSPLGRGAVPLCIVSLAGVWSAVPDTEPAVAMAGVLLPVAVYRARWGTVVGPVGSAALALAVIGTVLVGSAGRGAAATVVCVVGMLAVAPLVVGFRTRLEQRDRVVLDAMHVVVALWLPRVLMARSVPVAVGMAAAALGSMWAAAAWVRHRVSRAGAVDRPLH